MTLYESEQLSSLELHWPAVDLSMVCCNTGLVARRYRNSPRKLPLDCVLYTATGVLPYLY